MSLMSLSAISFFFKDEPKLLQRGENHLRFGACGELRLYSGMLIGQVGASYEQKGKIHHVSVNLGADGGITSTTCEYPRGAAKRSHGAALALFAYRNFSRTDAEYSWKAAKATKEQHSLKELYPRNDFNPLSQEPTEDDFQSLREGLQGSSCAMAWLLEPEPRGSFLALPEDLTALFVRSIISRHPNQGSQAIAEAMAVIDQQRDAVQATRVGQSTNSLWHSLREGRLTASNFGAVLPALLKGRNVAPSVIDRLMTQKSLDNVHAIQWGHMNEKEGIKAFEQATQLKVRESGLWLAPSGMLGASPDGLVGESSIIEVKCPYSARDQTIDEALNNRDFFLEKVDGMYALKSNHPYWHQVQGQSGALLLPAPLRVSWSYK